MDCPHDDCNGTLEASSHLYLIVEDAEVKDDGTVVLRDVGFSHVNDELDGIPINLEEFSLTCSEGHEFVEELAPELRARVGLQPVGNAPRTLGTRGGGFRALPDPPSELADAWARFQRGDHVEPYEARRLDEWRADCAQDAGF